MSSHRQANRTLIVQLTPSQITAIAPLYRQLGAMNRDGSFGMVVAQVFADHMRIGVLDPERSQKVSRAMGVNSPAPIRTAYDRLPSPPARPAKKDAR